MVGELEEEIQVSIKVRKPILEWIDNNFRKRPEFFRDAIESRVRILQESGFSNEIKRSKTPPEEAPKKEAGYSEEDFNSDFEDLIDDDIEEALDKEDYNIL